MPNERRSSPRARVLGVRVTYEGAAQDVSEAEVHDVCRGGLFIRTPSPVAVGTRISLEIHEPGEPVPWSALGRVIWIRRVGTDEQPAGMGVKLVHAEDVVLAALEALVSTQDKTTHRIPSREATVVGVGLVVGEGTKEAPRPQLKVPSRERTVLRGGQGAGGGARGLRKRPRSRRRLSS